MFPKVLPYWLLEYIIGDCIVIFRICTRPTTCMIPSTGSAFYNLKDGYDEKHNSLVL